MNAAWSYRESKAENDGYIFFLTFKTDVKFLQRSRGQKKKINIWDTGKEVKDTQIHVDTHVSAHDAQARRKVDLRGIILVRLLQVLAAYSENIITLSFPSKDSSHDCLFFFNSRADPGVIENNCSDPPKKYKSFLQGRIKKKKKK